MWWFVVVFVAVALNCSADGLPGVAAAQQALGTSVKLGQVARLSDAKLSAPIGGAEAQLAFMKRVGVVKARAAKADPQSVLGLAWGQLDRALFSESQSDLETKLVRCEHLLRARGLL